MAIRWDRVLEEGWVRPVDVNEGLAGAWRFDDGSSNAVAKNVTGGQELLLHGDPERVAGGVRLRGAHQYLETRNPVLTTTESYSVAIWVRLEAEGLPRGLRMSEDEYAWTAASQDSPTHSPFYLGVRKIPLDLEKTRFSIRWNVTMAPVDGSVTGTLEWRHAYSDGELTPDMLDKWFLLVAVCDVPDRILRLFVPGVSEGASQAPAEWPFWQASGGLQIGRARWLGNAVDHWPGSVGPMWAFSRALTREEALALYEATRFV